MASIQKRILQDGSVRWLAQVRKKGYKTVNITKKTKAAAEKKARSVELAIDNGTWDEFATDERRQGTTTLEYFIKRYLAEITPFKAGAAKGITNESSVLNQVLRTPLGKMDVYRIKTGHVIELRNQWRDKGNKANTINRKLTTLQDLFKQIRTTWRHENLNDPVANAKVKVAGGDGERSRSLNNIELKDIQTALDECQSPYVRWLFELALQTAARRRELLENTWDNFHVEEGWFCIPAPISKTRKDRYVPLTPHAKEILIAIQAHQREQSNLIEEPFPITTKSFEEAWKKAIKRSKVKNFQFRDTRHMATTMLSNIYPKMQDLAKITGHDKLETLLLYYEETIEDQVSRMGAFFVPMQRH